MDIVSQISAKQIVLLDQSGKAIVKENVTIDIENGIIIGINERDSVVTRSGAIIADLLIPGFIDIHNHGVGGHSELLNSWTNPDYTAHKSVKYGTTSILASVTFPKEDSENITQQVISALKSKIGKPDGKGSVIEGVHAEGPVVADLGGLPCGHSDMSNDEFLMFIDQFGSDLKIMTISPHVESKRNYERIKILQDKGVTVALGHDKKATETEILNALRLATSPMHMTHIFNVQTFHHRDIGLANVGILSKFPSIPEYKGIIEPTIEFIGDLQHLHPLVVQLILNSKDHNKIACITDAVLEPGATDVSTYAGRELEVKRTMNGEPQVVLKGTSTIAGSCTTLLSVFHKLINMFGVSIESCVQMLTHNPSQIAKLSGVGGIKVGNRADLLVMSDSYELEKTIVNGKIVYLK